MTAARQHRVDQIVPRALVAEIDFQAIVEEGEEVVRFSLDQFAPYVERSRLPHLRARIWRTLLG